MGTVGWPGKEFGVPGPPQEMIDNLRADPQWHCTGCDYDLWFAPVIVVVAPGERGTVWGSEVRHDPHCPIFELRERRRKAPNN